MFEILLIGSAAVAGSFVAWSVVHRRAAETLALARRQVARQLDQARQAAALTVREMEARAREEAQEVRHGAEALERQTAEENTHLEERLRKLELRLAAREQELTVHALEHDRRAGVVREAKDAAAAQRGQAQEKGEACGAVLEGRAGETAAQVKERQIEGLVEETRAQCADRLRNFEGASSEEFMRQAKRTMGIAMGRYAGHFLTERLTSTVVLGSEGAARLTDTPQTLSTLEEQIGVHFAISDTRESVRFEGGDGAARELARRVVTRLLAEDKVRDLPRLVKSMAADMDREIIELGKEAFRILGLEPAHLELLKLVGRLNFRTSYTQNQWRHTIEASLLAGLMAAELGLDVKIARRGTLLHDIGKALTHEVEGSHAVIGADLARRYGEDEIVANAIGSHHGDEPPRSPYAAIVAAADAMSGARPGARRETMETYVDRIADLERVAAAFQGVATVHAVQAGRELRIHVDDQRVDDQQAAALSESIARKISETMTFPGQIRVTVIREFKAIEIAN